MRYYKLNGQPTLDGDTDSGSPTAPFQDGLGSLSVDSPSVPAVFGGSPIAPGSSGFDDFPDFEEIIGHSPGADASAVDSTAATNSSTSTSATTQTVTSSGSGLVFNNTFGPGASQTFINDVDAAETYLQSLFSNACTVDCNFDLQSLNKSFAGENSFNPIEVSYSTFVNALKAHASTPAAQAAAAALASLPDPSHGALWEIPVGEAQILGLTSPDGAIDDSVVLNSYYWTSSALQNDSGDAEAVIEHELSEGIMGRIGSLGTDGGDWAPMDLFRFTASGQRDFTGGQDGKPTYFSVNGSNVATGLQYHNSISSNGSSDGFDLADWDQVGADSNAHDPFGPGGPGAGDPGTLSATDIQIMQALGWAPSGSTAPTSSATAVLVMDQASTGNYQIYDIGNNAVLSSSPLTQVGSPWQPITVGGFNSTDTSDLLLRNSTTGAFELYDVIGNNASGPVALGTASLNWTVQGFGDFSGNPGETDMLMRNGTALEVHDISNNQITGTTPMGAVGPEWQFLGVGDFSSNASETDMLMRDVNNGALEVYNVNHNAVVSATGMGAIGLEWSFVGVGDFSGNPSETDMLMRNNNNGALEVYNVENDHVVSAKAMGAVGMEWALVGIGDFSGNSGETDLLMRDSITGAFEIYDIRNDSIVSASSIGAAGLDWEAVGTAPYTSAAVAAATLGNPDGVAAEGGAAQEMPIQSAGTSASPMSWLTDTQAGPGWLQSVMAGTYGPALSAPAAQTATFEPNDLGNPASMIAGAMLQQHTA